MQPDSFWKTVFRIRKNEDTALQLDQVLLNLRHKAIKKHSSTEQAKMTILSIPIVWLMEILMLPFLIIGKFRSLLISLIVSAISLIVFSSFEFVAFILLTLLVWSFLNIKSVCEKFAEFSFDLFDLIFLGKVTSKITNFYSSLSIQEQKTFKNKLNGSFIQHLYTSRVEYGSGKKRQQLWEEYFVALFQYFNQDKDLLLREIDRYWSEASQPNSFYDEVDPIIFSENLNWISDQDWPSATPAIVKFVLNNLEDIDETRSGLTQGGLHGPRTLLGTATAAGAPLELIKMIVESGADLNAKQPTFISSNDQEFSIIHCAVSGSSTEVVEYLLNNGVKLDFAYQNHMHTIAEYAAIYCESLETLKLLIQRSESSKLTDTHGNTLLHYAAACDTDRSSQIGLIIEMGIEVNKANSKGETPIASFVNDSIWIPGRDGGPHLSNLRKIIELGGDPNIKTLESNSSSFLSAGAQSPLALLAGGQLDEDTTLKAAMLLVSAGAELDTSDSNDNTPLYDAVRKNAGLVKYLLECGADPNRQCGYFDTPFTSAVRASFSNETVHNYVELIEALLSSGGDPNANFFNGKKEMPASEAIIQRLKTHSFNFKTLKKNSPIREIIDKSSKPTARNPRSKNH